jgi:hypothetical protein
VVERLRGFLSLQVRDDSDPSAIRRVQCVPWSSSIFMHTLIGPWQTRSTPGSEHKHVFLQQSEGGSLDSPQGKSERHLQALDFASRTLGYSKTS